MSDSAQSSAKTAYNAIASMADAAYKAPGQFAINHLGSKAPEGKFITGKTNSLASVLNYNTDATSNSAPGTGWNFTTTGQTLYDAPGHIVSFITRKTDGPTPLLPNFLRSKSVVETATPAERDAATTQPVISQKSVTPEWAGSGTAPSTSYAYLPDYAAKQAPGTAPTTTATPEQGAQVTEKTADQSTAAVSAEHPAITIVKTSIAHGATEGTSTETPKSTILVKQGTIRFFLDRDELDYSNPSDYNNLTKFISFHEGRSDKRTEERTYQDGTEIIKYTKNGSNNNTIKIDNKKVLKLPDGIAQIKFKDDIMNIQYINRKPQTMSLNDAIARFNDTAE